MESERGSARIRRSRPLDQSEIEAVLGEMRWGVLSTSVNDEPYAVPVVFGWDGHALHLASGPGRKERALAANPRACLTVTDVAGGLDRWRSVVAIGTVERVRGAARLLRALAALRRSDAESAGPSSHDLRRLAGATVYRMVPRELTGRALGW